MKEESRPGVDSFTIRQFDIEFERELQRIEDG
jgi:hypothetical protein